MNDRQARFAAEFLVDLNATQAAIRAGYSERTAYSQGQRLLKNVEVKAAIQEAKARREIRTAVTQDMVMKELARIAFANGTMYAKVEGSSVRLTPTDQLTDDQKAAVVSMKETQFGIEVKLADKLKALQLLGRHLGMFSGQEEGDAEDIDGPRGEVFGDDQNEDA